MIEVCQTTIWDAIQGLDAWFDSMRVDWPSPGYGGPVVHWWNHSLAYQGAGFDWRYEGIVAGYLTLWHKTGHRVWRDKAIRAANDLVNAQLPGGNFQNSAFELNPNTGGTPHEAAADLALLLLAKEVRDCRDVDADRFLQAATQNIETYWFERLWDDPTLTLWDSPGTPSFVPNKAATFIDALMLWTELGASTNIIERYVIPTAEKILSMQVQARGTLLDGAIAQNRFGDRVIDAYFPLYIARCIPPLLNLASVTNETRFRDAAIRAARFIVRVRDPDGGLPQVLYARKQQNWNPRRIAGCGDVVRAIRVVNQFDDGLDYMPTLYWLLQGVRSDGHIATADGFDMIVPLISRRERFADELGVVGWCDKAFRSLSMLIDTKQPTPRSQERSMFVAAKTGDAM